MKDLRVPAVTVERERCPCSARERTMDPVFVPEDRLLSSDLQLCCRRFISQSSDDRTLMDCLGPGDFEGNYSQSSDTAAQYKDFLVPVTETPGLKLAVERFGIEDISSVRQVDPTIASRAIFTYKGEIPKEKTAHYVYFTWEHKYFVPGPMAGPYLKATGLDKEGLVEAGLLTEAGEMYTRLGVPSYIVAFVKPGLAGSFGGGSYGASAHPNASGANNVCYGRLSAPYDMAPEESAHYTATVLGTSTNPDSPLTGPEKLRHVMPVGIRIKANNRRSKWVDVELTKATANLLLPALCGRYIPMGVAHLWESHAGLGRVEANANILKACGSCPLPCPVKMLGTKPIDSKKPHGLSRKNFCDGIPSNPVCKTGGQGSMALSPLTGWLLGRMGLLTPSMDVALTAYRVMFFPVEHSWGESMMRRVGDEDNPHQWPTLQMAFPRAVRREIGPNGQSFREMDLDPAVVLAMDLVAGTPAWRGSECFSSAMRYQGPAVDGLSLSRRSITYRLNKVLNGDTPFKSNVAALIKRVLESAGPCEGSAAPKPIIPKKTSSSDNNFTYQTT